MKNPLRRTCSLILAVLMASTPVVAQERPRILVPEEPKAEATRQARQPGVARPELVLQTGVTVPATIIEYSPDGRLIASMSFQGGAVKLWEAASGRELCSLNLGTRSAITSALNSAFAFTPDSKSLVSISAGVLKQWETSTGTVQRSLAVNNGQDFGSSSFSGDARILAAMAQTRMSLGVFDVATGKALQKLDFDVNSSQQINAFALSWDGKTLATSEESRESGRETTNLVFRDVQSWRIVRSIKITEEKPGRPVLSGPIRSVEPSRTIRFTPDGRSIAIAIRDLTYEQTIGSIESRPIEQQHTIKVWDVASGRELQSIVLPPTTGKLAPTEINEFLIANSLAISRDGRFFATTTSEPAVRVFATSTGQAKTSIQGGGAAICAVVFSPDGNRAMTAGLDSTIRVWDLESASASSPPKVVRSLGSGAIPVTSLAFAQDSRSLAVSGTDSVNIWEFATGASLKTLELPKPSGRAEDLMRERERTHLGDGGQFVVSETAGEIKVWETRTGLEVRSLKRRSGKPVSGGALSADGKLLALPDEVPVAAAAASTSGGPIATGTNQPSMIPFPMPTVDPLQKKPGEKEDKKRTEKAAKQQQEALKEMEKMAKSGKMPAGMPDMSQMQKILEAAQSGDMAKIQEAAGQMVGSLPGALGTQARPPLGIRLISVNDGNEIASIGGSPSFAPVERAAIAFSRDSRLVASATDGHRIRINDTASGRELSTFLVSRSMNIERLLMSPDSRLLVASVMETKPGVNLTQINSDLSLGSVLDFTVRIWNVSDPAKPQEIRSLKGHTGMVSALSFSKDGRTLASGGYDTTIRLWDLGNGNERAVLTGHSLAISALQFNDDGSQLVSGSDDGSARLWQVQTGELLCTLVTLNRGADWLVITPDGLFDGTPGAWNQLLWRFSPNLFDVTPVEVFFNEFYYPGLLTAMTSGMRPRAAADVALKERRQPTVNLTRADGKPRDSVLSSRTTKVRVEVTGELKAGEKPIGARDVRLFRNGTLVKVWRGDVLKGQNQIALEADVPVIAGENRLTAYAFNRDNVKSVDAVLDLTGANELKRKGTAYILAFGVNRYANDQYNLKYAVPDARSFAEEVRAQQLKLGQYEHVEVITLADQDVTKENMLLALRGLSSSSQSDLPPLLSRIKPAQPEDAVIIYFAGHGTARGARFYLVPHDLGYAGSRTAVDAQAVETILAHSVSDLELETAIEGLDAERLLLIIDACNSGQALEAEEKRRGPMNSKGLAQLAYEKGLYILTAAQSYQAALEAAELGHGYLTYALVEEGLKQGLADRDAKDGQILGREWFNYATERVPQMQEKGMRSSRLLLFVEGEENVKDPSKRSIQRPRVFYRRELENHPMVIAKP